MKPKHIHTPLDEKTIKSLKAGDSVILSGTIYTARDQVHLRMHKSAGEKKKLPISLKGEIVYYCGPTPAKKGRPIGSCGPTTSSRMDKFTPFMLAHGIKGMIGKGYRSGTVKEKIKKHGAVYFIAPSGAGAYLSKKVVKNSKEAYHDLGAEAVHKLEVREFPLIVAIDMYGKDIYEGSR